MNRLQRPEQPGEPAYRSGVAARLVGVPVDTLRMWERRYSVVGPRVSAGRQRLYGDADIRRLSLIKQLVDLGHSIGAIAALDFPTLHAMRLSTEKLELARAGRRRLQLPAGRRIALVGSLFLTNNLARTLGERGFDVVATCSDTKQAVTRLRDVAADLVIVELATLRDADSGTIDAVKAACSALSVLVLYRFASSAVIRRQRAAGHFVTRTTTDAAAIESWCRTVLDTDVRPPLASDASHPALEPPPPRFDENALLALTQASRTIACECPAHLADLVLSLGSFERYSAECANENAAESALHQELRRAAGHARSIVEQALERVAEFEGYELPARIGPT